MISYFKNTAISLAVFLVLVMLTNWICGKIFARMGKETRNELVNYKADPAFAKNIFDDYHRVGHRYKPFTEWQMLPYRGNTLTINSDGLRTHTPPAGLSVTPVIRFFGGSTMWGEGSDDAHTIPALFHQKINQGSVFNHAQLAYNTRQNLDALITLYARGEQADVVIFYDGVNDVAFLCPNEINELPGHRLIPLFQEKVFGGRKQVIVSILNNLFTKNILLIINHKRNTGKNRPSLYNCVGTEKGKTIARMIIENWEMANTLVASRGGRFIAVLQPTPFGGLAKVDHLELDSELEHTFKDVYSELRKLISEKNYPWIVDMSSSLDGDAYYFIDFCHISPNGNEVVAEHLAKVYSGPLVTD